MPEKTGAEEMKGKEENLSGDAPVSDLKDIPGVGARIEHHMHNIGIRCVADLKGKVTLLFNILLSPKKSNC